MYTTLRSRKYALIMEPIRPIISGEMVVNGSTDSPNKIDVIAITTNNLIPTQVQLFNGAFKHAESVFS